MEPAKEGNATGRGSLATAGDPAFAAPQPAAVPAPERGELAAAPGAVGADPSGGTCACLRREFSGEPDAGNPHLRYDEGRVGRGLTVALSPTLPVLCPTRKRERQRAAVNFANTQSAEE